MLLSVGKCAIYFVMLSFKVRVLLNSVFKVTLQIYVKCKLSLVVDLNMTIVFGIVFYPNVSRHFRYFQIAVLKVIKGPE